MILESKSGLPSIRSKISFKLVVGYIHCAFHENSFTDVILSFASSMFKIFVIGVTALFITAHGEPFPFFEPVRPPRALQVMVHRGQSGQAPENSRPALVRCIEDGMEWAEIDVRLTKDHQHVIAHGATIEVPNESPIAVAEKSLAELKQIDIGSRFAARFAGEHLLSLSEALALGKGKLNFYLDCKVTDPELLAHEILDAGMERQVVVYDQPTNLASIYAMAPGKIALMTKWRPGIPAAEWVASNHLAAVEIDADQITPEVARTFHGLGIKVQTKNLGVWDNPEFWDKSIAAGADWMQTDLPEEVMAHDLWRRLKMRPVRFSLHRGANRYAPENTIPAFEKAIRLGADFVEFDVRTTSDGKFYLLHDSSFDGKTDGHGLIASTPASEVAALSAGVKFARRFADVRLPTLEEFLSATEGKVDLYFDAKAIAPEKLAEAVALHHMAERTVVYQSLDYLIRLKAIDPRIRALPPLGNLGQIDGIAQRLHPFAVDAKWEILSPEMIARCHALGILVFSDSLGEHERIEDFLQAMDWGIDLIQTDHPMRLLRAMELRAARSTQ
jgi:glycerophosphoryl diester phosphodiesterase